MQFKLCIWPSFHNGMFSGCIMYMHIVRCDCYTAIHLRHPKSLGIAYPSWITKSLFKDLSLSRVAENFLSVYLLVYVCNMQLKIADRR